MDEKRRITSHLQGILARVTNLMEKDMKLAFVFDGKSPLLKVKEQEDREYRKQQAEKKLKIAREEANEEEMLKYSKQTIRLNDDIIKESKELLSCLGMPIIQAPSEAEAQCSLINKNNDVYCVASSDADCILFGAPRLIRNLTLAQKRKVRGGIVNIKPELIEIKNVLKELDINQDQLIILGIMIGTDYNRKGIFRVGAKKALKLVKENKDYNKMFSDFNVDFDWKEIFDIFKNIPVKEDYKLEWNEINVDKILKLLVDEHSFNQERVLKSLEKLNVKKNQPGLNKWF